MIKKGLRVKILVGKDKNKEGEVIEIDRQNNRAKVKDINMVKKHVKTTKEKKGGIISKEKYNYNMRMYYPHMMDLLINESGLIIEEKYGNWDNSPLDEYSPMQIYICKKAD